MECIQETGAHQTEYVGGICTADGVKFGDPDPRPRLLPGRLQRRHRGHRARRTSRPTNGRRPTPCCTSPSTRWSGSARRCSLLGALARLGLVETARHPADAVVPARGRGLRRRRDPRPLVRLDRHRGRPPALDRPGLHADRGSGDRGGRDLVQPSPACWSLYAALGTIAILVLRAMSRRWREGEAEAESRRPYAPARHGGRRAMSKADAAAAILWVGATLLRALRRRRLRRRLLGPDRRRRREGRAAAGADPALADPGLGGQPRLADLHPRRPLDRLPAGLQRGLHDPLRADRAGGAGDRPARRRLRLPQVDRGRSQARRAPGATFALSSVLTPFFMGTVVGAIASGNVPADGNGDAFSSWLAPLPLLTGAMFVATGAYLSAVFLVGDARRAGDDETGALLRAPGPGRRRGRRRRRRRRALSPCTPKPATSSTASSTRACRW